MLDHSMLNWRIWMIISALLSVFLGFSWDHRKCIARKDHCWQYIHKFYQQNYLSIYCPIILSLVNDNLILPIMKAKTDIILDSNFSLTPYINFISKLSSLDFKCLQSPYALTISTFTTLSMCHNLSLKLQQLPKWWIKCWIQYISSL